MIFFDSPFSSGHALIPIKECITRGTCNGKSVQGLLRQFGEGALVGPESIFGQLHSRGYTIEPTISSSLADECVYQGGIYSSLSSRFYSLSLPLFRLRRHCSLVIVFCCFFHLIAVIFLFLGYITRHYGSLVGVDAIQIEIGSGSFFFFFSLFVCFPFMNRWMYPEWIAFPVRIDSCFVFDQIFFCPLLIFLFVLYDAAAYRSTPERIKKTAIDIGEVIAHFFQTHFVKYVPVY